MYAPIFHRLFGNLDPVLQGAAGSALFWILLILVKSLGRAFLRLVGVTTQTIDRGTKFREYIYRRFTSREGLINWLQGYHYTSARALRGLLSGLMFCCIALLFGGSRPVIWGICFVAALAYFGAGLSWLIPSPTWKGDDLGKHWSRVAELEKDLFGKVDEVTQKLADMHSSPQARDIGHQGTSDRGPQTPAS